MENWLLSSVLKIHASSTMYKTFLKHEYFYIKVGKVPWCHHLAVFVTLQLPLVVPLPV